VEAQIREAIAFHLDGLREDGLPVPVPVSRVEYRAVAALVAVDVALIAWLAQNFQSAENVLVILALVAVVFTTGAVVGVNHAAYRRISELENL
jgi:hypothetical protein